MSLARLPGVFVLSMSLVWLVRREREAGAMPDLPPSDEDSPAPQRIPGAHPESTAGLPNLPTRPMDSSDDSAEAVHAQAARLEHGRVPIFGLGLDAGLPDGINLSLVARPCPWARLQLAMGNNGIAWGWRAGATFLPFGQGPAGILEYGHYGDGNANLIAGTLAGSSYRSSPLFNHLSYDYVNVHVGLNFGYRRVVVFIQGGLSILYGELHDANQAVRSATTNLTNTEITVHGDPTIKASGFSGKLGLIAYLW